MIESLKQKVCCRENVSSNKNKNNVVENLELQFSLLQQENNFLKTEINQKQKTIDKLLDLNWLQSEDQYKVNDDNKQIKRMLRGHSYTVETRQRMFMMLILKSNLMVMVKPK